MTLLHYLSWLLTLPLLLAQTVVAHHWVNKLTGHFFSVAYNPQNYKTIYAGALNTVLVSYNAGETWGSLTSFPDFGIKFIAIRPVDTTIMFAGASHLWRSTNSGGSWSRVLDSLTYDGEGLVFDWQSPNVIYTAGME